MLHRCVQEYGLAGWSAAAWLAKGIPWRSPLLRLLVAIAPSAPTQTPIWVRLPAVLRLGAVRAARCALPVRSLRFRGGL